MKTKKIKLIEQAPLFVRKRYRILLIHANQKPATTLLPYNDKNLRKEKLEDITKLLRRIKLPYQIKENKVVSKPEVYTARDEKTLDRFLEAHDSGNQYEIGVTLHLNPKERRKWLALCKDPLVNLHKLEIDPELILHPRDANELKEEQQKYDPYFNWVLPFLDKNQFPNREAAHQHFLDYMEAVKDSK